MVVKVQRVSAEAPPAAWVNAPMSVTIGGAALQAKAWSLIGVEIEPFPFEPLEAGRTMAAKLTLPFEKFELSIDAELSQERWDPTSRAAVFRFERLGERERAVLRHFLEELLTGEIASVGDVLKRIDTPIVPSAAQAAGKPSPQPTARRALLRSAAMSALYVSAGALVFGYLGFSLYQNLMFRDIDTALLTAQTEPIVASEAGALRWNGYRAGDYVEAGAVVARFEGRDIEREIVEARLARREHGRMLENERARLQRLKDRAEIYRALENSARRQREARLAGLREQVVLIDKQVASLSRALGASNQRVIEVAERRAQIALEISELAIEIEAQQRLAERDQSGLVFAADKLVFVGELDDAETRIAELEVKYEMAEERLAVALSRRDDLEIRAPWDGVLRQVRASNGARVDRGDRIALLERATERAITAYVNQSDVSGIAIGDKAIVRVVSTDQQIEMVVRSVSPAFATPSDETPLWWIDRERDRTASVVLEPADPADMARLQDVIAGTPVRVLLEKRQAREFVASIYATVASTSEFLRVGAQAHAAERRRQGGSERHDEEASAVAGE
ncbi:MAG: HlyD family efflux transporter periplasmic adaptor subunit [Pseudomonadota bacterium]